MLVAVVDQVQLLLVLVERVVEEMLPRVEQQEQLEQQILAVVAVVLAVLVAQEELVLLLFLYQLRDILEQLLGRQQ
jgi:hypothetical protein